MGLLPRETIKVVRARRRTTAPSSLKENTSALTMNPQLGPRRQSGLVFDCALRRAVIASLTKLLFQMLKVNQ
jgi:hypothetical protein